MSSEMTEREQLFREKARKLIGMGLLGSMPKSGGEDELVQLRFCSSEIESEYKFLKNFGSFYFYIPRAFKHKNSLIVFYKNEKSKYLLTYFISSENRNKLITTLLGTKKLKGDIGALYDQTGYADGAIMDSIKSNLASISYALHYHLTNGLEYILGDDRDEKLGIKYMSQLSDTPVSSYSSPELTSATSLSATATDTPTAHTAPATSARRFETMELFGQQAREFTQSTQISTSKYYIDGYSFELFKDQYKAGGGKGFGLLQSQKNEKKYAFYKEICDEETGEQKVFAVVFEVQKKKETEFDEIIENLHLTSLTEQFAEQILKDKDLVKLCTIEESRDRSPSMSM